MLQPFELFQLPYVAKLRELKKRYLVSQTYDRAPAGATDPAKTAILLTDYDTAGAANIHWNAVKQDRYAAVLDLEIEYHREKLAALLATDSAFRLYWAVVHSKKELKDLIDRRYKEAMRRWLEKNTHWRIGGAETIHPDVDVTFGEVFISFRYAGQSIRVKFEEIEKA